MRHLPVRNISILISLMALTGCVGTFNPHIISTKLDDDLELANDKKYQFPPELNNAFDAANDQRRKYYEAIRNRSIVRNVSGAGMLVLSAAAIYKNVMPGSSTETTTKFNTWLAGTSGVVYGVSSFYSNKDAEMAYLNGYQLTTCSLLQMRPYIMTKNEFTAWQGQIKKLNTQSTELDKELLKIKSKLNFPKGDNDIAEIERALKNARTTYANASKLESNMSTAAYSLRRQVELINAAVSEHIQKSERDLSGFSALLSDPAKLNKGFDQIKAIPLNLDSSFFGGLNSNDDITKNKDNSDQDKISKKKKDLEELNKNPKKNKGKIDKIQNELDEALTALNKKEKMRTEVDSALEKVSTLYGIRRSVTAKIAGYNELRKTVKNIPACNFSKEPPLSISPDEDEATIDAGTSYEVKISGGSGVPKVTLQGATNKKARVETILQGSEIISRVLTEADSEDATLTLNITDSKDNSPQSTIIHVKKKEVKKPTECAADEELKDGNCTKKAVEAKPAPKKNKPTNTTAPKPITPPAAAAATNASSSPK